jgi:hypothetical protein
MEDSAALGEQHQITLDIGIDEISGNRVGNRLVETDIRSLVEDLRSIEGGEKSLIAATDHQYGAVFKSGRGMSIARRNHRRADVGRIIFEKLSSIVDVRDRTDVAVTSNKSQKKWEADDEKAHTPEEGGWEIYQSVKLWLRIAVGAHSFLLFPSGD